MKNLPIILSLVLAIGVIPNQDSYSHDKFGKAILSTQHNPASRSCPEVDFSSWRLLNNFLTNPRYQEKRKLLDLPNHALEKLREYQNENPTVEKVTSKHWSAYWSTQGVTPVTSEKICSTIDRVLKSEIGDRGLERHRRVFFRVKDKYVVYYQTVKRSHNEFSTRPLQILNKQFQLIADYDIR